MRKLVFVENVRTKENIKFYISFKLLNANKRPF